MLNKNIFDQFNSMNVAYSEEESKLILQKLSALFGNRESILNLRVTCFAMYEDLVKLLFVQCSLPVPKEPERQKLFLKLLVLLLENDVSTSSMAAQIDKHKLWNDFWRFPQTNVLLSISNLNQSDVVLDITYAITIIDVFKVHAKYKCLTVIDH